MKKLHKLPLTMLPTVIAQTIFVFIVKLKSRWPNWHTDVQSHIWRIIQEIFTANSSFFQNPHVLKLKYHHKIWSHAFGLCTTAQFHLMVEILNLRIFYYQICLWIFPELPPP